MSQNDDTISRQAAIDALMEFDKKLRKINWYQYPYTEHECRGVDKAIVKIANLPPVQTEWNNHTVACMLAELFDDTCACNYNGIDEWLPSKCELLDACPNPVGVACWEQYLKHRAERKTGE